MNKQDLKILINCLELCARNGLLAVDEFVLIGQTAAKAKAALQAMRDMDALVIQRASEPEENLVPSESNEEK